MKKVKVFHRSGQLQLSTKIEVAIYLFVEHFSAPLRFLSGFFQPEFGLKKRERPLLKVFVFPICEDREDDNFF